MDFISCAGYLGGGAERSELGLEGGPELLVTNLCVIDFAPDSKHMRLRSVHPGVSIEEVQEATGFRLLLPADGVPQTLLPSEAQVKAIREVIDPHGMRRREFRRRR